MAYAKDGTSATDGTPMTPARQVRELREMHEPYWRQVWESMTLEEEFLDGDRYEDDNGAYNKDRRLIQIRGQEIQDTTRHVTAEATKRPRNVEPRPIDRIGDPEDAEIAASLVEQELSNPWKGFDDEYEAAILSCREKRLGVVWMDYVPPEDGDFQFGEMFYGFEDPRNYMWDEAYDPHHPLCGFLFREHRMDTDRAKVVYKAPWLTPDKEYRSTTQRPDRPLLRSGTEHTPQNIQDNKVTIWECWYKNDRTTKQGKTEERALRDGERYMACVSGCGYRTEPGPGQPEYAEQACMTCGGDLERVDMLDETPETLVYAKGKRMIAIAPYCQAPEDKPLYDGKWPIPQARSFPALFLTAYMKPGRPVGPSDTTLMWDQQIASDTLATTAVQRVLEHRSYWELPRTGMVDYRGKRFEFREDQFNVMYRDNTKAEFGASPVQMHSGSGLDPQFNSIYGITQQKLTQYRGVADFGFTPESSKDIAASTVEQLTAQGEIPTEHFNRRKNRALGKFYGVVWDYVRATYTPQRLSRLSLDGVDIMAKLRGDDFPNFDFVISDTPPFTGVDKAKAESARELLQFATGGDPALMVEFMDIYAEMLNMPPSVVRKIDKRREQLRAEAEEAAMAAPPQEEMIPPGGGGDDMGFGMVPELESPNGAEAIQ